jgi:VIT1/CCC1 family predicted Fe2+/Mn2+ transporter
VTLLLPVRQLAISVSLFAILCLAVLGAVGAGAGGAPIGKAILRVTFWGSLALLATAAIGRLFGTVI